MPVSFIGMILMILFTCKIFIYLVIGEVRILSALRVTPGNFAANAEGLSVLGMILLSSTPEAMGLSVRGAHRSQPRLPSSS